MLKRRKELIADVCIGWAEAQSNEIIRAELIDQLGLRLLGYWRNSDVRIVEQSCQVGQEALRINRCRTVGVVKGQNDGWSHECVISSNKIPITAQLYDARDGFTYWMEFRATLLFIVSILPRRDGRVKGSTTTNLEINEFDTIHSLFSKFVVVVLRHR